MAQNPVSEKPRQKASMDEWQSESQYTIGNAAYLDGLYEQYIEDPSGVDEHWHTAFSDLKQNGATEISHDAIRDYFKQAAKSNVKRVSTSADPAHDAKQARVLQMISAYRLRGHLFANIDPLGLQQREHLSNIDLEYFGFTDADLKETFNVGTFVGPAERTLADLRDALRKTYCGNIGVEYMHMMNVDEKRWIQNRLEGTLATPQFDDQKRQKILSQLVAAEGIEKYLGAKFPGAKRFSLEGGESLIPMLNCMVNEAGSAKIDELVIGMAHRGRLNVLVNLLGKSPSELFDEFAGKKQVEYGSGDVKYHQGFSSDLKTDSGHAVHLALAFNPSHLEIVAPVVEGSVRARQERRKDAEQTSVLPVIIHGDAAFAGQGVVMETINMSQTRGYKTGGTVHIVINNQVGFTTSHPEDARSTLYCTDVAKMIEAPIFHVNSDDPDAVIFVSELAMAYRNQFKKDVVIDLVCYRRHGHNEADEPNATQPIMYQTIKKHKTTRALYADHLVQNNIITAETANQLVTDYRTALDEGRDVVMQKVPMKAYVDWTPYLGHDWDAEHSSQFDLNKLKSLTAQMADVPEGVKLHGRVAKIINDRVMMAAGEKPVDWGFAETAAYATLLDEGYPIRLSGQDSGRGTFFHRHAVFHNQLDNSTYIPLKNLSEDQPDFTVIDSFLSEEAVLAFEYGYATTEPNSLVIWEAQFGDFANGAQVVIDQFISSGEHKWGRLCGLTMLLPHGYEGQGPEHSSARLERFLQLCAEHNIQVCVPSTPAQVFHMLRRQMVRPMRRPLIVMSPKSLLRHKMAVSSLEELSQGEFQVVIDDAAVTDANQIDRVVMCSGKVFYELLQKRDQENMDNVALVRIEQLYPFPEQALKSVLSRYQNANEFVWCQEEPKNQGAWYCSLHHLRHCTGGEVLFAGRRASAAPAAGSSALHDAEQKALIHDALGLTS